MSVPARDNSFGEHRFFKNFVGDFYRYYRNGNTTHNQQGYTFLEHRSERKGQTSNPKMEVNGVPDFRRPSSYRRMTLDLQYQPQMITRVYTYANPQPGDLLQGDYTSWNQIPADGCMPPRYGDTGYPFFDIGHLNMCEVKALNKLGDERANLGEAIATARQSINLVSEAVIDLLQAYRSARRGNFSRAMQRLGITPSRVSERYIQYQYGWRPLMQDVYGTYQLLAEKINDPTFIPILSAASGHEDAGSQASKYSSWRNGGDISYTARTKVGFTARVTNDYDRTVNQLGLNNPASLTWDLIPWSFVVDWVVPIGPVLQAFTATAGLSFVAGYRVISIDYRADLLDEDPPEEPNSTLTIHQNRGVRARGFGMRRETYSDFPTPKPYVRSPFTTDKALKAIALIDLVSRR